MVKLSSKNRLDLLTDDLFVGEILSRVNTIESIVRLSLVSRKLYKLCQYAPVMEVGEITDGIVNYLNQFFAFRINSKIRPEFRRFRISMKFRELYKMGIPPLSFANEHLLRWFRDALSLNVRELILQVDEDRILHRWGVTSLKLHSYPLKHLRVLTLENIPVGLNESFEGWVSTCCVSLEELHQTDVVVFPSTLNIISSSLRVFTINAEFRHLHVVSAPKLVTLHVMWIHFPHKRSPPDVSLRVSSAPNLKDFVLDLDLENWYTPIFLEYFSFGDKSNFPSLQSASLKLHEIHNIPLDSLKRFLLDVSQTRDLHVTETILHKISLHGKIHLGTSFDKLEKLQVEVDLFEDEDSMWGEQALSIMSFVKEVPSLKTFTLTIYYLGRVSPRILFNHELRESLVDNIFEFGISRPAVYLNADTIKVELSPGEDETSLVLTIMEYAPLYTKLIFLYP